MIKNFGVLQFNNTRIINIIKLENKIKEIQILKF